MTAKCRQLLEEAGKGRRLSFEEGLWVYNEADSQDLRLAAVAIRDRHSPPTRGTYLIDRNVNYTNVCITDCKFCEFYRPVGHEEGYVLTRDVLSQKLSELVALGGSRVLLQGGHHPGLRIEWYEELLSWIKESFPSLDIDAFSPSEIEHIAQLEEISIEEVLQRLKASGLNGVPGGGGEILDDEIRIQVSPKKIRTAPWFAVMEAAQELGLYTTASQVIGFGEEPRHRLNALLAIRDHQDRALEKRDLGFMAFIAWPLKYESRYGEVFGRLKGWKLGAEDQEYLRHTAFCRVFLDNIAHFQASWPTMGLECAQEALRWGCDDMGGTMMEENVVSQAGSVHCSAAAEGLRDTIVAAGLTPMRRDSWYRILEPAS